ncbi:MAG: hypothetical protein ACNA8P_12735, partial [Phycisphaerales bacterium]
PRTIAARTARDIMDRRGWTPAARPDPAPDRSTPIIIEGPAQAVPITDEPETDRPAREGDSDR